MINFLLSGLSLSGICNNVQTRTFFEYMKSFLLALLMLPPFTTLFAQDAVGEKQLPAERRNEAGVLVEFSAADIGQNFFMGLQYKHFGKKNIGYKIFAGVGV